jgi:hypothetical protein
VVSADAAPVAVTITKPAANTAMPIRIDRIIWFSLHNVRSLLAGDWEAAS